MGRDGVDQIVIRGIGILPALARRILHRGHREGRWSKDTFVRTQSRKKGRAAVTLLHFWADEGHRGRQFGDEVWISGSGHALSMPSGPVQNKRC